MNLTSDEGMEKIVRAYFIARQEIAVGKSSAKVMQKFEGTAKPVLTQLARQGYAWSSAHIEYEKLHEQLVTYKADEIDQPSRFSFSWLRPLFYCLTGSLACVGLLIVANHGY
ncbi:hypothetical protein V0M98_34680 (plasmid) [Pseudomonas silesiensis]|uniref:hypothetical protein n=1 Tax=Pseudomonas silesiensis TaxID=1853130 RepID=UPI0030D16D0D